MVGVLGQVRTLKRHCDLKSVAEFQQFFLFIPCVWILKLNRGESRPLVRDLRTLGKTLETQPVFCSAECCVLVFENRLKNSTSNLRREVQILNVRYKSNPRQESMFTRSTTKVQCNSLTRS